MALITLNNDLKALRTDDASFYLHYCTMSDTVSDHEPVRSRAAKRVCRAGEDDDEVLSNVDFPINPLTRAAANAKIHVADVLD